MDMVVDRHLVRVEESMDGTIPRAAAGARQHPLRGIGLMTAACCLLPTLDGIAKYIIDDYHPVQIVWGRLLFQSMLVVGCLVATDRIRRLRSPSPGLLIGVVGASWLSNFPIITSLAYLPLADAFAIVLTAPLMVTAFSVALLGERVGAARWTAVCLGFGGAMVVIRPGLDVFHWASLLPLVSAALFSLYQIGVRRLGADHEPLIILAWGSVLPLAATSLIVPAFWTAPDPLTWGLLAAMGFGFGTGHLLLILALRYAPASFLAPIMYVQLISSTVFGLVVFGDFPDGFTIAGAAIVAVSGIYIAYAAREPEGGPS